MQLFAYEYYFHILSYFCLNITAEMLSVAREGVSETFSNSHTKKPPTVFTNGFWYPYFSMILEGSGLFGPVILA